MPPTANIIPGRFLVRCVALGILLGVFAAGWDRACATLEERARLRGRQDIEQAISGAKVGNSP